MDARNYLGNNLSVGFVKNLDQKKLVILTEGVEKVMQDDAKRLNFIVEVGGQKKNWMPNPTTMQNLIDAYDHETKQWIGKIVNLSTAIMRGKEVIIGTGEGTEKPQPGSFGQDVKVPNKCSACDKEISDAEKGYSIKAFAKTLCRSCQDIVKKNPAKYAIIHLENVLILRLLTAHLKEKEV